MAPRPSRGVPRRPKNGKISGCFPRTKGKAARDHERFKMKRSWSISLCIVATFWDQALDDLDGRGLV